MPHYDIRPCKNRIM